MLISSLGFDSWIRLIIGVLFFSVVFVFVALLTRTVTRSDIGNLRIMISDLGPLSGIVNKLLNFAERIMGILKL